MKNFKLHTQFAILTSGLFFTASAQQSDPVGEELTQEIEGAIVESLAEPAPVPERTRGPRTAREAARTEDWPEEPQLRMNFRGASLESVLGYMSSAAGFNIVLDPRVQLRGRVDIYASQPVTREEAYKLFESVLYQNSYAVKRDGRNLEIMGRRDARLVTPIVGPGVPSDDIPESARMVTQIIGVRQANASQLLRDLMPLLPQDDVVITANDAGNAIFLTATETEVKRIARIVEALDSSISSTSELRVFPLRYTDAVALAEIIEELFATPQNNQGGGGNNGRGNFNFGNRGRGGRGNNNNNNQANATGGPVTARVAAVGDEQTNSLIVTAPEGLMSSIANVVRQLDVSVNDVTEMRVFKLRNANPVDIAEQLAILYPDETQQNGFAAFFGNRGRGGRGRGNNTSDTSERAKRLGRVTSVADARTSSIIVTAARELMEGIELMITRLDSDDSQRKQVFVFDLENADPLLVEETLRMMFEGANTANRNVSRLNQNQGTALMQRQQGAIRGQGATRQTGGNTFGGGRGGGGGATGGGGF